MFRFSFSQTQSIISFYLFISIAIITMAYIATDKRNIITEKGKKCLMYEGCSFIISIVVPPTIRLHGDTNKTNQLNAKVVCVKSGDKMNTFMHQIMIVPKFESQIQ